MLKIATLGAGLGLLALSVPAAAHAQYRDYGYGQPVRNTACERQKSNDKAAGAVVGALVGALAGGALGNEIGDNDPDYRSGRSSYGRGHGYGRGRGYDRGYRYKSDDDDNDGEVAVGVLLGAVIGGVAGSELGGNSSGDCQVAYARDYGTVAGPTGSIPRTTDGLYGGPEIYEPAPPRSYPASGSRPYPARDTYPSYPEDTRDDRRECRTVYQETQLPDGRITRDPVTACRDGRNGGWVVQDGEDDELFGY